MLEMNGRVIAARVLEHNESADYARSQYNLIFFWT
jgi:hypothetical protein